MGEDCGTWAPQLHLDWQSPKLIPFDRPQDVGKVTCIPTFANSGFNMAGNGALTVYRPSELPNLNLSQSYSTHGWFACSSGFCESFLPDKTITETFLTRPEKNAENISPHVASVAQKRQFIVVDQSGDQTTFYFSSGFGSPIQRLTSSSPKFESNHRMLGNVPLGQGDSINVKGPSCMNEFDLNQENDGESEMPDDTKEIDAMFFSDEDDYSTEDDEVASTGHSPSTMTKHCEEQEMVGTNTEEVASSLVKSKKRKLHNYFDRDTQLLDTASSLNVNRFGTKYEAVESRYASDSNHQVSRETGSCSGSKRMRKERITDILSALQNMIPGGKDKDPIMLLDEAIYRLKSLKHKAKLLGLHTL